MPRPIGGSRLRPDGSMNVAVVATDAGEAVPVDDWVHALDVLRPA